MTLFTIFVTAHRDGGWVCVANWERFGMDEAEAVAGAIRAARDEFPADTLRVRASLVDDSTRRVASRNRDEGGREAPLAVRIATGIQHHPARADLARRLLADLADPDAELVADPDPPPSGTPSSSRLWNPWRTYRHAIETTPAWATHRLILQDDVIVCPRFAEAARLAVAARPDRVITFYVGGNARVAAARVVHAASRGRCWVDAPQFSWFPAVAVCWPSRLLQPLLDYVDRQRWPREFRADDEIIGRFLRAAGETPLATVPSLVDHPDDVPSLIGQRARGGADRNRVAACWVGSCDATAVDWDE